MKIVIPTRGEVELTELLKESSEQRIKQPNIVVNSLVRELIECGEIIEKLMKFNTEKEIQIINLSVDITELRKDQILLENIKSLILTNSE